MADFYDALDEKLIDFIEQQHFFVTGSAAEGARVNVSPKGMDTFRVIDNNTVGYLDMIGSGNETSAHIENDGRLTIMMCSFDSRCWILRLYGRGEVIRPMDPRWDDYIQHFETFASQRQIILLHIESAQTSCGYGVPRYDFKGHRDTLDEWGKKKTPEEHQEYIHKKNLVSIDGLKTGWPE